MIRVLVVDDETLVRTGLRMILQPADDIEVVGEAADGREAVEAVLRHRPDVVLLDVRMPVLDGISAAAEIGAQPSPPRIVMLTTFDLDDYVHSALKAGAVGFLLKDAQPHELVAAVRTAAAGNAMLAPTVTKRLISRFADIKPAARARLEVLTAREREVVLCVARGLSNAEIGRELSMSETTVKAHVSRSLAKLDLTNRVQAAILVHDAGLA
ncbi:response regulator transcription factor [Saccharopolyspora hirsuta]|uniref:Response regulator transcription factor n=1 Tax=Saccharopolyspora hirsuta TaxID=1837 RepID=A0A5M7BLH2_SACHI|nr:response regulator transcription factor [Saccharopolyspora hirsuta]KAA5830622.1 response regulator transcription factor [Saccharopolyspora hirsuta]